MDLHLNLRGEYFDQIKEGTKIFEYRLDREYWRKRIVGKQYENLVLLRGYPRRGDLERTIKLPYRGYEMQKITHSHFGKDPVQVFAIILTA